MLVELTMEGNEEYFVIVHQHGGNDVTCNPRIRPEQNMAWCNSKLGIDFTPWQCNANSSAPTVVERAEGKRWFTNGRKAIRSAVMYLLLGLCLVSNSMAAKIVMLPMFGGSHYLVIAKLGTELVNRGHKVRYTVLCLLSCHCCNPLLRLLLALLTDFTIYHSAFPYYSLLWHNF